MSASDTEISLDNLKVREYRPEDQPAVVRLYTEGLLAGQIAPNDTGVDIENIPDAYLSEPRSGFWVADLNGVVRGMVAVAAEQEHTAEIRRLRVDRAMQNTPIGSRLIEHAVSHCKELGYLKIVFDTRFELDQALDLFDRFGFQHTRTKSMNGKDLLEFYLDLYRQPNGNG